MAKQNKKKAAKHNAKKVTKRTTEPMSDSPIDAAHEVTAAHTSTDETAATSELAGGCVTAQPGGEHADSCATPEATTEETGTDDSPEAAETADQTTAVDGATGGESANTVEPTAAEAVPATDLTTAATADLAKPEEPAPDEFAKTPNTAPASDGDAADAHEPAKGHARSDARLPPVGTTIRKLDRHGLLRCECTVEEGGIRFDGQLYASLSGAASAAAKKLGLGGKSQNGYVFWGLEKPPRPVTDPVDALTAAWDRFHERAATLVAAAGDDDRPKIASALASQLGALESLRTKVA